MARAGRILALSVALWGFTQLQCWTGPGEVHELPGRRGALLGASLAGLSPAAHAEEVAQYQSVTPTGDPYLERVDSRTGDFSIQLPVTWQKEFDSYAGRLIMSVDPEELKKLQQNQPNEMVTLRCARLTLPALLRSAQYMPRQGDDQRSDWKEVALGDVTGASIAEWLMRAGQQALATSVGMELPQVDIKVVDFQITEGPKDQSILSWHATSQVQASSVRAIGQEPDQVQGLGGKSLVPLSQALTQPPPQGDVPPLSTFGQAILRKGVVTFAVAQGPLNRIDAAYKGPIGKQYLDYIVQSLKVAPVG
eukprot:Skav235546  [mRNA]  locus=scaffold3067:232421:233341:+ [translate_table: standard]